MEDILESDNLEAQIADEKITPIIRLDYKLKTCAERAELVNQIVAQTPQAQLTPRYLEILSDYIMNAISKEEKKEHLYLTDNRLLTINKRETSFEGLAEKFENGEDGIYNLMTSDKNILLAPKISITDQDLEEVPGLKELRAAMSQIEEAGKKATGKKKFLLKKQLIEMRKDQYILKNSYKAPMGGASAPSTFNKIDLSEVRYIDENGDPQSTGLISFFNPEHISAILCNYSALKIETHGHHWDDFFYLMEDFDQLLERTLSAHYPMYLDIVKMKTNNKSNLDIQKMLKEKYGVDHTVQHISSLWRNKIPKLIAEQEQNDFLIWYYSTQEEGKWKRCSCCHQRKLASPRFFSKNKTSKDGFYSLCKICRNKK